MPLPTPTLHTARLRLRPFEDSDADALFALHSNAYVLRYWDSPPWTERARAEKFLATCREMEEQGTGTRVAVDRAEDGAFIGWCTLNRWNPDFRSASLGYCYNDSAWGHGYATEAAREVLRWAFDSLDVNRVQAEVDTRNVGSARVLEKLGFLLEGTLREDCVVNGDVSDSWVYGLLRRDWPSPSEPAPAAGLAPDARADSASSVREVAALVHEYARLLDGGDLDGVAALFEHATWRSDATGQVLRGSGQVRPVYDRVVLYNGTPRTKHLMTNLDVELVGDAQANARCYFTVLQGAVPGAPIEVVLSGRYIDRFEKVEGRWRFADRLFVTDLVGDLSRHYR